MHGAEALHGLDLTAIQRVTLAHWNTEQRQVACTSALTPRSSNASSPGRPTARRMTAIQQSSVGSEESQG